MYKVCFDENKRIIGFNIKNCIDYINLFSINDVEKEITIDTLTDKLDSFGRRIFLKKHKETGKSVIVSLLNHNDYFEDEQYEYFKQYNKVKKVKKIKLIDSSDKFSFEDIINIKKDQLVKKFNCSYCELYETFEDISGSNCVIGNSFIRITEESNCSLKQLKCRSNSEVMIYCESDNNVNIFMNNKKVNTESLSKISDNISLSFNIDNVNNEVNIYSVGILFK